MLLYKKDNILKEKNMSNKILAVVNGRNITEDDLNRALLRFPKDRQQYFLTDDGKKQLLNQIISFELFYNYGKDNKLDEDEKFLSMLENAKKELLTQTAIDDVLSKVSVTDKEAEDYYKANINLFKTKESVKAKHILVDTLEKAKELKTKVENGMPFEEAAKKYSSCPSNVRGGDLGTFTRGQMVPEFEDEAFKLEIGKISDPVKTQFGYHLIKVEQKNKPEIRPFKSVAQAIKNRLVQERQNYEYMKFAQKLKDQYPVEIKC